MHIEKDALLQLQPKVKVLTKPPPPLDNFETTQLTKRVDKNWPWNIERLPFLSKWWGSLHKPWCGKMERTGIPPISGRKWPRKDSWRDCT